MEVSEFLEVASIKWWSTKYMVERTTTEKKELAEKARREMAVMDSFTATAELEREQIDNLQGLCAIEMGTSGMKTRACRISIENLELLKSSALGIIGDQGKEPNVRLPVSPLVSEDLASCRMKYLWLLDMAQLLETTYKVTTAELEDKALQEMEQQWDFQEALHAILDEQYHALDHGTRGAGLFPHHVLYPLFAGNDKRYALRISKCAKCNYGFPFNDVVIA
jgi:hypothetical protein